MSKKLTKVALDVALTDWFQKLIKDNNLDVEIRQFIHDEDMPDQLEIKWDLEGSQKDLDFIRDKVEPALEVLAWENNSDEDDGIFIHTYWLFVHEGDCFDHDVAYIAEQTNKSYDQYACMESDDIDWEHIEKVYPWGRMI